MSQLPEPVSRKDALLHNIADGTPDIDDLVPVSREEIYLKYIAENGSGGSDDNYKELLNKLKETTATENDVAVGKVFVNKDQVVTTGTNTASSDFKGVIERTEANPILPSDLTTIGRYAFYYYTNLVSPVLPSELTSIGEYAFQSCTNLALTSLPSGITSIGNEAFYYCTGLTEITFEGKPNSIASSAFNGCTNLTTIRVPWNEGEVANAPWGATNASLIYGYTPETA